MNKVLFEIGLEELPSSEYKNIFTQLKESLETSFKEKNISYDNINVFIAPRRFGAMIDGLPEKEADTTEERKGPAKNIAFDADNNPTKALLGFLNGAGAKVDDVYYKEIKGVEYVHVKIEKKGLDTKTVLEKLIPETVMGLKFKKPMRWSHGEFEYVRPVHWTLGLFNDKIIDFEVFGKKSSNITFGHRIFGKQEVINHADEYEKKLGESFAIINFEKRVERIKSELERIRTESNLIVDYDEHLIEEIAQLTEYPTAVVGEFKEEYMYLPEEVIIVTIKHHQRSFVAKQNGKLTNKFVSFQDGYGREENVVRGYARVINARLDDAAFYYNDDMEMSIESRLEALNGITYQQGLGTYKEKVERIEKLASFIGEKLSIKREMATLQRAAKLCKIDVPSNVVFEFPELQGAMGRVFLLKKGEEEAVYISAEEHYHPVEETDYVSKDIYANVVSLADRIDDIAGFFGINKIPSGSKDPFALRRKAFGVLRIIIETEWDLDLKELIDKSAEILNLKYDETKMAEFIQNRLQTIMEKESIRADVINATIINWRRPLRALLSAKAITEYFEKEEFKNFITAFQRVNNITKNHNSLEYQGRLFVKDAEKELFASYLDVNKKFTEELERINYKMVIETLIELKPAIDKYFDEIFVMDKDESIRLNRLGFLKTLSLMFVELADITKLYA